MNKNKFLSSELYQDLPDHTKMAFWKNMEAIEYLMEVSGFSFNDLINIDDWIRQDVLDQAWWVADLIKFSGMSFDELLKLPDDNKKLIIVNAWGVSQLMGTGITLNSLLSIDEDLKSLFFYATPGLYKIIKQGTSFESVMALSTDDKKALLENAWTLGDLIEKGIDFNKIMTFDSLRRFIFISNAPYFLSVMEEQSIDNNNIECMIDALIKKHIESIKNQNEYQEKVKKQSEDIIKNVGGKVYEDLPCLGFKELKSIEQVVDRALVLNAMIQLPLKAPKDYINTWILDHEVDGAISHYEASILYSGDAMLSEQEYCNLYWAMEALWAIVWATGLIDGLPCNEQVGNTLASLSPDLQKYEDGSKYIDNMKLRSYEELYEMRDLYYRLHYWLSQEKLEDPNFDDPSLDMVIERRKALEWIMDQELDWDNVSITS